jgi:serine/threonine protein kinase
VLGKGAWAVVYEAIDERDGNIVAVKAIPKMLLKRTPKLE